MPIFLDKETRKGHTQHSWSVDLDLGMAWKIEAYDFQDQCPKLQIIPYTEELFRERLLDTKTLFGIAWVMCRDQALEYGIKTELEFASCFDGPALLRMKEAIWRTFCDFFPEMATTFQILTSKFSEAQKMAESRLANLIDRNLNTENLNKILDQETRKAQKEFDQQFQSISTESDNS